MSRHNATARREATVVPMVLFGDTGRTCTGNRPADADLIGARSASANGVDRPVRGPHLRTVRSRSRSKTGIPGISLGYERSRRRHYYWVNLGQTKVKFCLETLGRVEALRRAVALRNRYLRQVALDNAPILAARQRGDTAGQGRAA